MKPILAALLIVVLLASVGLGTGTERVWKEKGFIVTENDPFKLDEYFKQTYLDFLFGNSNIHWRIDEVRDTANAALAGNWNWYDSAGHGPDSTVFADTSVFADTIGGGAVRAETSKVALDAIDVDTSGTEINAALALRNNVVADSSWEHAMTFKSGANDSIVLWPYRFVLHSDADSQIVIAYDGSNWANLSLNAIGELYIDPSSGLTNFTGTIDAVDGTVNADSADIDGGVDISGDLEVGADIRLGDDLWILDENRLNLVSTDGGIRTIINTATDYFTIAADPTIALTSGQDSIWFNDDTYITGDLSVTGTFNKIRCGEVLTDTCTSPGYRFFVTISPAYPDTDYTPILTPAAGWYASAVIDSPLTTTGFWISAGGAARVNWMAVKQ